MENDLNVKGNLYGCNTLEEHRKDTPGGTVPSYEEITILKTEVKEEAYDFGMPAVGIEFRNVKEEYISSPENNFEKENSELAKGSERPLNETIEFEHVEIKQEEVDNKEKFKSCLSDFDKKLYFKSCDENHFDMKTQLPKQQVQLNHNREGKRYKCEHCVYLTPSRSSFIIHIRTHTKEKPFKCTYRNCNCTPGKEESCECPPCEYAAAQNGNLKQHILARHKTEPMKYSCTDCKYATHSKQQLKMHIRIHTNEKPFKCTYRYCEYAAIRKRDLSRHILEKHIGKPKEYVCKDCKYATHRKEQLAVHVRMHTNVRPYKCTYKNCKCTQEEKESCECKTCEYAATQNSHLKQHILAKHSGEPKKYKCTYCAYVTHRKGRLEMHVTMHINEKPFKCTYTNCQCTPGEEMSCGCNPCDYATTTNTTLKRHILKKHGRKPDFQSTNMSLIEKDL